ncbi:TPA: hypothetical protein ACGO00_000361 [Streptococcus suis]
MTNEKLGVLLVDVPEPSYHRYYYLEYSHGTYSIFKADGKKRLNQKPCYAPKKKLKNTHNFGG